jgi:hypothetical protein
MEHALLMMIVPFKDTASKQTTLVCQLSLLVEPVLLVNQSLRLFLNADMVPIASIQNAWFHTLLPMEILESQMPKEMLNGLELFVNQEPVLKVPLTGLAFLLPRTTMPQISSLDMPLLNNAPSLSLLLMEQQQPRMQ